MCCCKLRLYQELRHRWQRNSLGQLDAGHILANLHKHNYFTNKLAGSESVYEYHPLFREFLLSRAHKTYLPARVTEIRRIAAGLVESAGQAEIAADLLRDAEDWKDLHN